MSDTVVDPDVIPGTLRDRDQWLLWDRSNETPRRPHWDGNFHVSWSDPDAWHSFGAAVAQAAQTRSYGIGYVTAAENPDYAMGVMTVIDIDGAADGDDRPKDWLPSLSPFFERGCYLEWSPSHHEPGDSGVHIPVAGSPPDWWSDTQIEDHEGIDVLANKFCTFTGDLLSGAGQTIAQWSDDWVETWLMDAYEALTGEPAPPRQHPDQPRETGQTRDYDDDWPDAETAEEMLEHISADCAYEQWRNIGFALASHFPEHEAKRLFDRWSRSGRKYDDDATRLIDDIVSRGTGGVGIGTLVHHAQQAGWEPDTGYETPSPKELVARNSDEYATPADVPDDIFAEAAPDGGAAAAGSAADEPMDEPPQAGGGGERENGGDEDPSDPWEGIRQAYRGAENADERLPARYEATNRLLEERSWRAVIETDHLWQYDEERGIYRRNGARRVRQRLSDKLQEQFKAHEVNEIVEQLAGRRTVSQEDMGGPAQMICTRNCVLEIGPDGIKRHPHSPEHNFIARLDAAYDPDAECPQFEAFLDDVVEDERDKAKLQEFAGYTLHHWGLPYHKALFLVGPTASGKSTFLDTIRRMLGDDATTSLTPQQMTSERFGGAELFGSWANIRNDIPNTLIENTGMFKELVAGDPIKAEQKYEDPFFFEPTTKHLFSANELPSADTDDDAFFRRILLVAFPSTIPKAERDPHLDDKLQNELSGVLNWALAGLQRLLRQGRFTGDRPPVQTQNTWEKWGSSVERFAQLCVEEGSGTLEKKRLYKAYVAFCEDEGIPAETQHKMTRVLKQEGYEDGREYDREAGEQVRVFTGITATGRGEEFLEDSSDGGSIGGRHIDNY